VQSQSEQAEVERSFQGQGAFAATNVRFYWIGFRVYARWPTFSPVVANNRSTTFFHWGTMVPQGIKEPNAITGLEFCAGANASEAYGGAWGWSDENCGVRAPFVCKLRECLAQLAVLLL
jgi:hypothetical protein